MQYELYIILDRNFLSSYFVPIFMRLNYESHCKRPVALRHHRQLCQASSINLNKFPIERCSIHHHHQLSIARYFAFPKYECQLIDSNLGVIKIRRAFIFISDGCNGFFASASSSTSSVVCVLNLLSVR